MMPSWYISDYSQRAPLPSVHRAPRGGGLSGDDGMRVKQGCVERSETPMEGERSETEDGCEGERTEGESWAVFGRLSVGDGGGRVVGERWARVCEMWERSDPKGEGERSETEDGGEGERGWWGMIGARGTGCGGNFPPSYHCVTFSFGSARALCRDHIRTREPAALGKAKQNTA